MAMTDPIADLLTRIRNGAHARKEQVDVPWSKVKARIVEVLTAEGYLKEHSVVEQDGHRVLRVWLRYDSQNRPVIIGLKRVSRPSLRIYVGADEIPPIRARTRCEYPVDTGRYRHRPRGAQAHVGGEIVCSVW